MLENPPYQDSSSITYVEEDNLKKRAKNKRKEEYLSIEFKKNILPKLNEKRGSAREYANLLRMKGIDLSKLPEEEFDPLMGEDSGGAVIFANTGGVMEAAARSAYYFATDKEPPALLLDLKPVRGLDGIKRASFEIPGVGEVKVVVCHGLNNARKMCDDLREAKAKGHDVVIIDTAGRLAIDEEMMREIQAVKDAIRPSETLFVVDSMTGQDAVNTAKEFNDRLDFDGVVLTKLDGDTRGGAALSIRTVVDKPIKFVGMGEKMDALDVFHPERMADRILGMGDIVSLVERAQQLYDEREARRLEERIAKDQFDFNDFLTQIHQIKKMGNIKELAAMIPGVGKALKDIDINDDAFKSIEAIIYSMTPEERAKPHILDGHRRKRIALGSGTTVQDVNKLLTQFTQTRKMMKTLQGFKGGKMPKIPSMPMGKPRF